MFKNAGRVKRTIEEYFVLTVATLILVVGVYVFKFPNNFSFGGVTGIAVVLSAIMPTTPGNITFIINMALLVLGFIFLGKSFGIKTVYVSVLMSVGLSAAEKWFPMSAPLTSQPVLELIYAIVLPAASSAILFNVGASGGGTDRRCAVSGRPVYCTCILPCLRCADRSVFPLRTSGKITGGRQCDREY